MQSYHGTKALDHEHFDNNRKELDRRKLWQILVSRNSNASEGVHDDIDPSLLTFDHALDVAMILIR